MAGNGTAKIVQGLALAVVTVSVGAAIGYYAGGAHTGQSANVTTGVQETGTPPDAGTVPTKPSPHVKIARPDSDYTAPGAPRIHIVEATSPSLGAPSSDAPPHSRVLHRSSDTTDTTDIPTPDAEASQEASQPSSTHDATPTASPSSAGTSSDTEATQTGTADTTEVAGNGTPSSPTAPAPGVMGADTASPRRTASPASQGDPEATQVGDTGNTTKSAGAALYRVQAGTFADAKNAHDYLTNLQSRGYDASMHTESQGGQTVYHVQVGAYHDRAAAEDAAAGFRHDGVPVTISPISP